MIVGDDEDWRYLMTNNVRYRIVVAGGGLALGIWVILTAAAPPLWGHVPMLAAFVGLTTFSLAFSFPITEGSVSLMPMLVGAAYMIMGKVPTGWVVLLSVVGHAIVRSIRARSNPESREPRGWDLIEVTALNAAMHIFGFLAGSLVFEAVGGSIPLRHLDLVAVALGAVTYLGVNYILAAGYLAMRDRTLLVNYLSALPTLIIFEGGPVIFSPLVAVIYNRLGVAYFSLFALTLALFSYISHNLAVKSRRLRRRIQELSSLQAVGSALSASLDVEAVVTAIYEQAARLMPAPSFYVGLYDHEQDEVSFPLIMQEGERFYGGPRRARRGLTEYLLETREPLLITEDVGAWSREHGLEVIGREAACWVGTPIVAGTEALGVIAVQSYDTPGAYDRSHRDILKMIADQAAIAIKNARLYERTDEALARRVQELDSVLRTTREGVLLIDRNWRVLAANPALAEFIDVAQLSLIRQSLEAPRQDGPSLIELIGYTSESFRHACDSLLAGEEARIQTTIRLTPTDRYVERTLTPVREVEGDISGWLLVFRDMREELALKQLREDMTDMLVHDLRSPLSMVIASLQMMPEACETDDDDRFDRLIGLANRSSDRILRLIDDILDISQLESGQFPMKPEPVHARDLFQEIISHFGPVAASQEIVLTLDIRRDLPTLSVDRSLMIRVLYNLVDNALKFTPEGGKVFLHASRANRDLRRTTSRVPGSRRDFVEIYVQDSGPGIPEKEMSRLFEKFQLVTGVRGRRRGTGLGLPFCKLVVEQHGGAIWAESEVGKGSTFHLTLPTV